MPSEPTQDIEHQFELHGRVVAREDHHVVIDVSIKLSEGFLNGDTQRLMKLCRENSASNATVTFTQRVDILEPKMKEGRSSMPCIIAANGEDLLGFGGEGCDFCVKLGRHRPELYARDDNALIASAHPTICTFTEQRRSDAVQIRRC